MPGSVYFGHSLFLATLATHIVTLPLSTAQSTPNTFRTIPLQSRVTSVQPWTGIVLWADNEKNRIDAIQLEYSYVRYDDVVVDQGSYDWSQIDRLLDEVASRGHQAILRFYFVYPGRPTTVPTYIKLLTGYKEIKARSEGKKTEFVDWSHPAIQQFVLDFYSQFAQRYDSDSRLAYLQTGFGLWAEYHIYSGPREIGKTFPSKAFQISFIEHLNNVFRQTPWMISVDAADNEYSPFETMPELRRLQFGLFDDSFLCKQHSKVNALNWAFFGSDRWKKSPGGGEFSYYNRRDQRLSLSADGPNGRAFEDAAAEFHVSFMIGNDQPRYQSIDRIREAGMAIGYRLRVTKFESSHTVSRVKVINKGVAPPYHDAYVTIDGVRARDSLRGLLPGESRVFEIPRGGRAPQLTIESDRLTKEQRIQYDAQLN